MSSTPKSDQDPEGQLFTHVYMDRSVPLADSEYFRKRIGLFLDGAYGYETAGKIYANLRQETGVGTVVRVRFETLFGQIKIQHLLNSITVVWRYLHEHRQSYDYDSRPPKLTTEEASNWLEFVRRATKEENLHYTVDDKGGVHYLIDQEFVRNQTATLKCLENGRYDGVRAAFEAAMTYLEATPQDTKAAVRSIFEAVEILARMMVTSKNLHRKLVETELTQLAIQSCGKDHTGAKATALLFAGFADWVDAVHNYRHGQGTPEVVAPSLELAVYLVSTGSSFLRWLVWMDRSAGKTA